MINSCEERSVLLFVVDAKFDVTQTWLGIPYNANRFRIPDGSVSDTCFGPSGSATLSMKDSRNIPPLTVEVGPGDSFVAEGQVLLVLVTVKEANRQRVRHVVHPDGSVTEVKFYYKPTRRVCFEEGDAFFLGEATPLFEGVQDRVTLEYAILPRQNAKLLKSNSDLFSDEEIEPFDGDLSIMEKGRTLEIRNICPSIQKQITQHLPPRSEIKIGSYSSSIRNMPREIRGRTQIQCDSF